MDPEGQRNISAFQRMQWLEPYYGTALYGQRTSRRPTTTNKHGTEQYKSHWTIG